MGKNTKNIEYVDKIRSKYQGKVLATVSLLGEKKTCLEIAKESIEKALILLRIFSPTVFYNDNIPSYFCREGSSILSQSHFLITKDKYPSLYSAIDCKNNPNRHICNEEITMLKQTGLDQVANLLFKDNPTELEEKLIKSISMLVKSIISSSLEEKILFSLCSIETLLLKNNNEPIQSNIGRRLAYLNSQNLEERKEINKLIKEAYILRSKFIHHGQQFNDTETLNKTRLYIFETIMKIVRLSNKILTHQDLINKIEDLTWV